MRNKIAIVTGATKGIGLAIAHQLEVDGFYVYGTYVRDYDKEVIKSLETPAFELKQVDARDFEACVEFVNEIHQRHGSIDVLVNNAGIVNDSLMMRMKPKDFTSVIDVNLVGPFHMTKAITKLMMRQKYGSIVNITSVIGIVGNIGQANYAASKAGLIGFSKSLAKEYATRGIRVNCVAPGFIKTDMTESLDESITNPILDTIALKSFGESEDVAHAVSFLVSDKAKYITGQTLNVCGGMVI